MQLSTDEILGAPGFLIRRCQQIATAIFLEEAAEFDFSPTQYAALAFIHLQSGLDQSTLGERIACDRSSVTKCVERLEERNLIRREISPVDKRARLLYSTPDGAAMLEKLVVAARRSQARVAAPLGEEQSKKLFKLLKELGDALNDSSRAPVTGDAGP
ncbi:MarR family winged helix-turn-helix transcriptional regulator [Rhizobium sp. P28RR-XV]|uniref:MarR family winged helix-turn-helix transcriptional regulator n=1 Tax=Rhizobium sp. P28RR-XV TaxID=2726737 RepID=UPI001456AE3B|nr:MarR family winged helix-turn-helix transcriptional regulator [Rhizobium sp. P28RR-XV]NLR88378.1 winged helix-turn-helix transcriptional regulator [Rhizobium sp. P28RR-XV]